METFESKQAMDATKAQAQAEFEADEEVMESGSFEEVSRIHRKRYDGTSAFDQAKRGYNKAIDDDRLRKAQHRAADSDKE
jgi:hypothetical protein